MRTDLRAKHDVETRRHAAELFDSGMGCWGADADVWLANNSWVVKARTPSQYHYQPR